MLRACSKGVAEKTAPQRQRIAGFAAVVEERWRNNAVLRACSKGVAEKTAPQRQRIADYTAVVERKRKGNAAQRVCCKGDALKAPPQRRPRHGHPAVTIITATLSPYDTDATLFIPSHSFRRSEIREVPLQQLVSAFCPRGPICSFKKVPTKTVFHRYLPVPATDRPRP